MTDKTYPLWFNIIFYMFLALPIIGVIMVLFINQLDILGFIIVCIGYLGIWIIGEIAKNHRKKWKIN